MATLGSSPAVIIFSLILTIKAIAIDVDLCSYIRSRLLVCKQSENGKKTKQSLSKVCWKSKEHLQRMIDPEFHKKHKIDEKEEESKTEL